MSLRSRARKVQARTGYAYQTCLGLVRGELQFFPVKEGCITEAALEAAKARPDYSGDTKSRRCECPVCDPGE